MTGIANGLALYVVFLFSTSLHEAAHAWAALKGGDTTATDGGQLTLSPLPHIKREPIGMVVLPLISVLVSGFPLGFASAPYDPRWAERHPQRAGLMALAGPGANLLLVLCSGLLINVGLFAGVFAAPDSISFSDVTMATAGHGSAWAPVAYILGSVFSLNLLLTVFNLLPVPPLDGSGALVLLLPQRFAARYHGFLRSSPYLAWVGIFIAWRVFDLFFNPVFGRALNVLYVLHGAVYS